MRAPGGSCPPAGPPLARGTSPGGEGLPGSGPGASSCSCARVRLGMHAPCAPAENVRICAARASSLPARVPALIVRREGAQVAVRPVGLVPAGAGQGGRTGRPARAAARLVRARGPCPGACAWGSCPPKMSTKKRASPSLGQPSESFFRRVRVPLPAPPLYPPGVCCGQAYHIGGRGAGRLAIPTRREHIPAGPSCSCARGPVPSPGVMPAENARRKCQARAGPSGSGRALAAAAMRAASTFSRISPALWRCPSVGANPLRAPRYPLV